MLGPWSFLWTLQLTTEGRLFCNFKLPQATVSFRKKEQKHSKEYSYTQGGKKEKSYSHHMQVRVPPIFTLFSTSVSLNAPKHISCSLAIQMDPLMIHFYFYIYLYLFTLFYALNLNDSHGLYNYITVSSPISSHLPTFFCSYKLSSLVSIA